MTDHQLVPGAIRLTGASKILIDSVPTFAALRYIGFEYTLDVVFTFDPNRPGDKAGVALRMSNMFHVTCTVSHGGVLTLTQHMR